MKKFIDQISSEIKQAFSVLGYNPDLGKVTVSNRPDLCEYQCNGAMAGAKEYRKAPLVIANEVAEKLKDSRVFSEIKVAPPGFLNLKVKPSFVCAYLKQMIKSPKFGLEEPKQPLTIIVDYGGPNVAKPLHIGHLRSAIIGESIKRIIRYAGHTAIGDVHLGDWGLQMGLIIVELNERKPELVYFDPGYDGEYPAEPPFSIAELGEIYPFASARSKVDESYREKALQATFELQNGRIGYRALWQHIMRISLVDLKENYRNLDVDFDLWKGESDVQDLIPAMIDKFKEDGFAYLSNGAFVIDIKEETDTKEMPPGLIVKSDGAYLYLTTDLATILERMKNYSPEMMIYTTDKRQSMHFEQLFRCARKTGIVPPEMNLRFLGFGTMNGADGKPFKTRDGGVMRLEDLVSLINEEMYKKIIANRDVCEDEARKTAQIVGLAALKYGDLSNQAAKDYIFDIDRFTSFEGDTGPYILYTIVRIKSILQKYTEAGGVINKEALLAPEEICANETGASEKSFASDFGDKALMLTIAGFNAMIETAYEEIAPHRIAAYIYELANALNTFYHQTKILTEPVNEKQNYYIALLDLTRDILETCIDLLGFSAPERM
ncbi:MAG: arginine--tRNA ligase [Lachnospiraceae bacterium]|nr:arginine--tRNA ligase [Lachnospiraceae bacterium]